MPFALSHSASDGPKSKMRKGKCEIGTAWRQPAKHGHRVDWGTADWELRLDVDVDLVEKVP